MSEQSSWKFESSITNLQPHAYISRQNVLLPPLLFWGIMKFPFRGNPSLSTKQYFQAEPTPLPLPAPVPSEERPGHGVIEGHPNTGQLRHISHRYCTYWLICHEYKIHTYCVTYYIGEYLHFRYLKWLVIYWNTPWVKFVATKPPKAKVKPETPVLDGWG